MGVPLPTARCALVWARSACCGLRYRFGATLTLRTADAPSACLTQQP
ncbi:MAG: hypothetical protein NZ455_12850 [Bacteroidia bacterium]|nr:hypothetical protein [Bacteroidia bacterium]